MTLTELFTNIANAIRSKTGSSASIKAEDFPSAINGISVGVEGGIIPTGTKDITENGTHDVTNFATANVSVPIPEQKMVTLPITIASDLGAGTTVNHTLITGNAFIKSHYADEPFFAMLVPLFASSMVYNSNVIGMIYHGNRVVITSKSAAYGVLMRGAGSSSYATAAPHTTPINGKGYSVSLRVNSSGDLQLYVDGTYTVPAGNYLLALGMAE